LSAVANATEGRKPGAAAAAGWTDCRLAPFDCSSGHTSSLTGPGTTPRTRTAAGAATTLTLLYSMDGSYFYAGRSATLSEAGDFRLDATSAARFVRLLSSAAATLTASLAAK
jgi:hypothetical protein